MIKIKGEKKGKREREGKGEEGGNTGARGRGAGQQRGGGTPEVRDGRGGVSSHRSRRSPTGGRRGRDGWMILLVEEGGRVFSVHVQWSSPSVGKGLGEAPSVARREGLECTSSILS